MASVVVELTGDEAKLLRSMERTIQRQDKMIAKFKDIKSASGKAGSTARTAGKQTEQAFGARALSQLKSYAIGIGTVSMATRVFAAAMTNAQAKVEATMSSVDQLVAARSGLLQIAKSTADKNKLFARANQLAAYGITRPQATQLKFAARSEGFEGKTVDNVAKLLAAGVFSSVEAPTSVAGQVPALFRGKVTPAQSINMMLSAARASRANFEQLGGALPVAAQGGALAGSSPAETMALLSVLTSKYATPEAAATGIRSIGTVVGLSKLKGSGIVGAVQKLKAMPEPERHKILKERKETNIAYKYIVEQADLIKQRQNEVEQARQGTGTAQSFLAQTYRQAVDTSTESGRANAARVATNQARVRQSIDRERRLARSGYATERAYLESQTRLERVGTDPLTQYEAERAMRFVQPFGQSGLVRGIGSLARSGFAGSGINVVQALMRKIGDISDLLTGAARTQQQAAGAQLQAAKQQARPDNRAEQRARIAEPTE